MILWLVLSLHRILLIIYQGKMRIHKYDFRMFICFIPELISSFSTFLHFSFLIHGKQPSFYEPSGKVSSKEEEEVGW